MKLDQDQAMTRDVAPAVKHVELPIWFDISFVTA